SILTDRLPPPDMQILRRSLSSQSSPELLRRYRKSYRRPGSMLPSADLPIASERPACTMTFRLATSDSSLPQRHPGTVALGGWACRYRSRPSFRPEPPRLSSYRACRRFRRALSRTEFRGPQL